MSDFHVRDGRPIDPDANFVSTSETVSEDGTPAHKPTDQGAASRVVKTSMTLPRSSVETIRKLSEAGGTTMAEVVRKAVAMEKFLQETTDAGGKILIKYRGDSQLRELLIR